MKKKQRSSVDMDINKVVKGAPREVADLMRLAHSQGYFISRTAAFHFRVVTPLGMPQDRVITPGTPSDHRSMKNARSQLRRIGVEIPH